MLIPSEQAEEVTRLSSLSRRVNANSQLDTLKALMGFKLIKKGEC